MRVVLIAAIAGGVAWSQNGVPRTANDPPPPAKPVPAAPVAPDAIVEAVTHPLDPLTGPELRAVTRILRDEGRLTESMRFSLVTLNEPPKDEVARFQPGGPIRRQAFVVTYDKARNSTFEAVVDLTASKTAAWNEVEGVQPPVLIEEYEQAAAIVQADPRLLAAMVRRGITDLSKVQLDTWAGGGLNLAGLEGARLLRVLAYYRGDGANGYGRPIEGVMAIVDVSAKKVVEFVDRGTFPIPGPGSDPFDAATLGAPRTGLKPLHMAQPEGVSFEVRGHEVRWQNWRFRYALHAREGLVLYGVGYEDGGRVRPILARASLSEMVVPYGDADGLWNWRNAFDQGEYGLGQFAATLIRGEDVPENAVLTSAVHANEVGGEPILRKDTVAIYEQDGGLLWRHMDYLTLKTVSRRGRQLAIHYLFTVGNYDYGLRWIFHQDGTLEAQVELTGILLAKGTADVRCSACEAKEAEGRVTGAGADRQGTVVARTVVAPNHQHFFCFRLDLDVDGPRNRVDEANVLSEPIGPENPAGNGFFVERTPLKSEAEAVRDANPASHRTWRVFQPESRNAQGHTAGYVLEPGPAASPFFRPDSLIARRAGCVAHPVWVTRERSTERHAAGDYPSRVKPADGLPEWSADGESIDGEDLVVWHVLGVTHVPRPEEWPVMPVARAGFRLTPDGFFLRNPALDVAPSAPAPDRK